MCSLVGQGPAPIQPSVIEEAAVGEAGFPACPRIVVVDPGSAIACQRNCMAGEAIDRGNPGAYQVLGPQLGPDSI